jgi:hypothetical protein
MAAMAIPAAQAVREDWITPKQQLEMLLRPIHAVIAEVADTALPVWELASIVAEYAADNLSPSLTNWHTALDRLNMLPDKILPLPLNICQILDSICPIRGGETKKDGTAYKVSDTHSLYLIPPDSLNELEARVNAYGQEHLAEYGVENNPLQFRYFWSAARSEHGDNRSNEFVWVLFLKDVLAGSRIKTYQKQAQMVAALSTRVGVNYEVPTLRVTAAVVFLHKIATGESILQAGKYSDSWIFTRVQETTESYHLVVGGFSPEGLNVTDDVFGTDDAGVAIFRRF